MSEQAKKYTVITGASAGIGRDTARAFASRGKNLILAARRRDRLEGLKNELLAQYPALDIIVRNVDLSVPENVHKFYGSLKNYRLETWINNAGFGHYGSVSKQNLEKIENMLRLNITALTILSTLFVRDYQNVENTQLINVSSCGGYIIVPNAVAYCAAKFYVSAFTEGLARELQENGAKLRAKVFAPAAAKTEFGKIANDMENYDYDKYFGVYHTSAQAAAFLLELYDSDSAVGAVNRENFIFSLGEPLLPYAGQSAHNQKI